MLCVPIALRLDSDPDPLDPEELDEPELEVVADVTGLVMPAKMLVVMT